MNPDTVRNQRFLLVRRGYDPDAVVAFLDEVADALEASRGQDTSASNGGSVALDVAEADRLVDEARTRAATQRLRAQRDIEALQRTARARRARLVAEIEELALARDQLAQDLDRAAEVVDRVVAWVRRTDPAAPTDAVAATSQRVPDEQTARVTADGVGAADGATPAVTGQATAPDEGEHASTGDPAEHVATVRSAPPPETPPLDEPTLVVPPHEATGGADDEERGDATQDPATDDVLTALRAVQDDVLARLRGDPGGSIEEWLPSATVLLALDDAATGAASRAFLDGWHDATRHGEPEPEVVDDSDFLGADDGADGASDVGGAAMARDALEVVRGAGLMPDLGLAHDLRVALRASLERGVGASETGPLLVERVTEVHRDVRQTVLPLALAQVLGAAHHHGLVARWAHDGVAAVAWVLGEEQRCPGRRCRANASDGVVAPGESFAFGELVPPAHAGCTCTLRPATPDEVTPDEV